MTVSKKCNHALRAMFELAMRQDQGVTTIAEIAAAQKLPLRFLEAILVELKRDGLVDSRRGVRGGYVLAMDAHDITVGQIVRLIDGRIAPAAVEEDDPIEAASCGRTVFARLWQRSAEALASVYDATTLHDLIEQEQSALACQTPMYMI